MTALCLFFLLILRIFALFAVPPHPDEIVQILMTDDIAHLKNFPLYFYGQTFMGPLESYLLAPFVRIFGSYYLRVRVWNELFYLGMVFLFVRTVKRLFDRELSGYVLFFLSVAPFAVLFFTTVVGYGEVLLLAILSLVFLLKVSESNEKSPRYAFILGILSGLAFWCNPIYVIWLVPLGVSLIGLIPSSWKKMIPFWFGAGFLAGLFPAWIYAFQAGRPMLIHTAGTQFTPFNKLPQSAYLFFARLKYFLTTSFFEKDSLVRKLIMGPALFVFGVFLVSFGSFLVSFLGNFKKHSVQEKIFHLFILLPPFILAGLYISRDLNWDEGIRYFLPLMISYAFVMAWWIKRLKPVFLRHGLVTVLGGIMVLSSLASLKMENRRRLDLVEIFQFLQKNQLQFGVGDLNSAYGMNALSHGQIQVTPALYEVRYASLWKTVMEKGPQFFIFEQVDHRYKSRLAFDPHLKKATAGRRDIYYGPSELLREIAETKEPL